MVNRPTQTPSLTPSASTEAPIPYDGEPKAAVQVIFRFACLHRHEAMDAGSVMRRVHTTLSPEVIKSIIDAALKLLPPDNSPQGRLERQLMEQEKKRRAIQAEDAFVRHLEARYQVIRESDVRRALLDAGARPHATPDVVFEAPVTIVGAACRWIECKSYFGFGRNPYVAASERKQIKKYVDHLGPGIVVFRLGYEQRHLALDGVRVYREQEMVNSLE